MNPKLYNTLAITKSKKRITMVVKNMENMPVIEDIPITEPRLVKQTIKHCPFSDDFQTYT